MDENKAINKKSTKTNSGEDTLKDIVALAKRRGFVFQSSEIYGGLNGCWDYGPLGVELLNNIKNQWWKDLTYREDIEGIDASILMHPRVWEASGHVENFTDPMVDCRECKARFRADELEDAECGNKAFKRLRIQLAAKIVQTDERPASNQGGGKTFIR